MRRLTMKASDNRIKVWSALTPQERAELDKEFAKCQVRIARICMLKTTPVTPNPIFK